MRTRRVFLLPAALSVLACVGLAQAPAVSSFSNGTVYLAVDGTDTTVGWRFTANQNLTVSALGFWEIDAGSNLNQTHQVGLWNSGGTLLASATVQTNSPLNGSWRYVSITPVSLTAGQTYTVGAVLTSPYSDTYQRVPVSGGSVSTNSLITIGNSALSPSAAGFAFPSVSEPIYLGRFGPNLIVAPITTPSVPVSPETLGMIGIGLVLMAYFAMFRFREMPVDDASRCG